MNIIKHSLAFLSLTALFCGCTEDIDLSLSNAKPRLVVDGHICDMVTDYNFVRLTMSADYFSNAEPTAVSGASVQVSDGSQVFDFIENASRPGYYMAPDGFSAIHNRTYSLSVTNLDTNHDGQNESYSASQDMPPTYVADSVVCYKNAFSDFYHVALYAPLDHSRKNFYMFGMSYKDSLASDAVYKFGLSNDDLFTNDYCWGATIYTFDQDYIRNATITKGDDVSVHLLCINESYYDYLQAINDIRQGGTPMFSSAPANAVGNISNDALGFFTAFSVINVSCKVQ